MFPRFVCVSFTYHSHHPSSITVAPLLDKMLTSTLLSALATAATASAAKTYLAYAWNETAPEIHGKAVQARNGYFYLGGQAFPVCADDDFDCAAQNKTLITGPLPSKYSTNYDGFFMDITDSEVQEIVTSPNTGGLLYTMPKTELAILDYKTRETIWTITPIKPYYASTVMISSAALPFNSTGEINPIPSKLPAMATSYTQKMAKVSSALPSRCVWWRQICRLLYITRTPAPVLRVALADKRAKSCVPIL